MNGHTRKLLPAVLRSAAITCVLAPWTVPAGAQERAIIDHPMTARLDVTLTDEPPLAQAVVIITAWPAAAVSAE